MLLARGSSSLKSGLFRMFGNARAAAVGSLHTYRNLDSLVNRIDADEPYIYCLLVTDSWNPL